MYAHELCSFYCVENYCHVNLKKKKQKKKLVFRLYIVGEQILMTIFSPGQKTMKDLLISKSKQVWVCSKCHEDS